MELELSGRTALVTGATSGLGRAVAVGLAAEGVRIVGVGRRTELLESLAEELPATGVDHVMVRQDLAEPDAPAALAEAVAGLEVDILVNNAGGSAPVDFGTPDEEWRRRMTLNFEAARALTHRLLPGMRARGWGRVVNVTGVNEPRGLNATLPAKAALESWAKGLSREVAREGVTVNCVAPGRIHSGQVARDFTPEAVAAFSAAEIPAGRFGEAEEFADVVVFLASERARYVTGARLQVDGGFARA